MISPGDQLGRQGGQSEGVTGQLGKSAKDFSLGGQPGGSAWG